MCIFTCVYLCVYDIYIYINRRVQTVEITITKSVQGCFGPSDGSTKAGFLWGVNCHIN